MTFGAYDLLNKFESTVTFEDMMEKGGLNYEVVKRPNTVFFEGDNNEVEDEWISNPFSSAVVKKGTKQILGSVGVGYGLVQNREVAEICEVWNVNKEANYVAAGAPNLGERIYIVMKSPEFIKLGDDPNSRIENYFLVTSAHDGSEAIVGIPAPMYLGSRTILMFPNRDSGAIRVKHSKKAVDRLQHAKNILSHVKSYWEQFVESFEQLTTVPLTDDEAQTYFAMCVEGDSTRAENIRSAVTDVYKNGLSSKMKYANGTLFGAYLALATYTDHERTVKKSKRGDAESAGSRLHALLLGSGARLKAEGLGFALQVYKKKMKL